VKVETLALLIVDDDRNKRQMVAALVSDRYRSVTAAAPDEVGRLIAKESFDVMIARRMRGTAAEDKIDDSNETECVKETAFIRSGVTGNIYEFTAINQNASNTMSNPFERVMLQVAIERAELSLGQIMRITEHDAIF
jgi:DNA-binding NtrC family response regulator